MGPLANFMKFTGRKVLEPLQLCSPIWSRTRKWETASCNQEVYLRAHRQSQRSLPVILVWFSLLVFYFPTFILKFFKHMERWTGQYTKHGYDLHLDSVVFGTLSDKWVKRCKILTAFPATWQACAVGPHTAGKTYILWDQGLTETEVQSGRTLGSGMIEMYLLFL